MAEQQEQVEENKRVRPESELAVKKTGTFIHPIDIWSMAKHPAQLAFCDLTGKIARKLNRLMAREIALDFSCQTHKVQF